MSGVAAGPAPGGVLEPLKAEGHHTVGPVVFRNSVARGRPDSLADLRVFQKRMEIELYAVPQTRAESGSPINLELSPNPNVTFGVADAQSPEEEIALAYQVGTPLFAATAMTSCVGGAPGSSPGDAVSQDGASSRGAATSPPLAASPMVAGKHRDGRGSDVAKPADPTPSPSSLSQLNKSRRLSGPLRPERGATLSPSLRGSSDLPPAAAANARACSLAGPAVSVSPASPAALAAFGPVAELRSPDEDDGTPLQWDDVKKTIVKVRVAAPTLGSTQSLKWDHLIPGTPGGLDLVFDPENQIRSPTELEADVLAAGSRSPSGGSSQSQSRPVAARSSRRSTAL